MASSTPAVIDIDSGASIKDLAQFLTTENVTLVKKALKLLSSLTRKQESVEKLRKEKGIPRLIDILSRPNNDLVDLSLGVLANCALLDAEARQIVS